LLDNTLLFWPNELSQAEVHDRRNLPYLIAGRAGGQVSTGRYLTYPGNPHNELLASLVNLFGGDVAGFGEADFPGVLSGLV
jgi:hypothetical protein